MLSTLLVLDSWLLMHSGSLCLFNIFQVPKSGDGQPSAEMPQEVLGSMKQISYKTEIIGGVPIITATQVRKMHQSGPTLTRP